MPPNIAPFCMKSVVYKIVRKRNNQRRLGAQGASSGDGSGKVLQTRLSDERQIQRIVLAEEAEFSLGALKISPPTREVMAGARREVLQPRIMQVLVALARRRGEVVSRDELILCCWDGNAVSDDAIHRCIGRIRRLAESHGGFNLVTVPRVGYQLTEEAGSAAFGWNWRSPLLMTVMLLIAAVLLVAAGFVGGHLL